MYISSTNTIHHHRGKKEMDDDDEMRIERNRKCVTTTYIKRGSGSLYGRIIVRGEEASIKSYK